MPAGRLQVACSVQGMHPTWVQLSTVHKLPQEGKCALTSSEIAQALTTGSNGPAASNSGMLR